MSGPKDVEFVLASSFLLGLLTQRTEQESAWVGRVAAMRPAVRKPRPAPRAAIRNPLPAQQDAPSTPVPIETSAADAALVAATARLREELDDNLMELEARSLAFDADANVREVVAAEVNAWNDRRVRLNKAEPTADSVGAAHALVREADDLVARALSIMEQRRKREYVLKAIVDSLHAVGYFTDEPQQPGAADPSGPITLVARKADEKVTISLPLGEDVVHSTWGGFAGDKCVDSFMGYVAALGERGVSCTPSGPALADRPRLRQAGRKDLPRSGSREA